MSIEKHSRPGWFYVKHYPGGRNEKPERLPIEGFEAAVALDNSLKSHKTTPATSTFPKLKDAVDSYLLWARGDGDAKKRKLAPATYETRERRLERFIIPHFGKYRVRDLNQTIFDEYAKTVAKWTYYVDLISVMALIKWMVKRKQAEPLTWCPEPVTGNHAVKSVPHPSDLFKVIDSVPKETHRMLFRMMLYTGLRWNEAKNLLWEDVDMNAGTIRVKEIENAAQDIIFIPEPLREWLKSNMKASGLIWEGRGQGKPLRSLNRILLAAGQTVGLEHVTSHTLRHASGTYLYEQTQDLYAVQKHLRHKDIATTQIYAKMSVSRRKSSVASIVDYMEKRDDI
jgi:integrase